jgi:TonB-dependent starch-binding outer membrane protein SusC
MKKNLTNFLQHGLRSKMLLLTGILWLSAFSMVYAQKTYEYKGVVTNIKGETLPGVSVTIKGTTQGAITGLDGDYKIISDKEALTLTFSFTGMITKDVEASPASALTVVLEEKSTDLTGVMIIGYGTQKKSNVTGSIGQIKSAEITQIPVARVQQSMAGRVAGVNVTASSGSPGAGLNVLIRGAGTNGNSQPLYVVDGMKSGNVDYLVPDDIASIEVLKDAASCAIYGSQGANGVVIITTKSGKSKEAGTGNVDFSFQYGWQSMPAVTPVMNSAEYATYINEAAVGVTIPTNSTTDTKWSDQIINNGAPTSQYYLSFSGGNEKSSYLVSGSYFDQQGVIGGDKSNYKRYSVRFNGQNQVKKWLNVSTNIAFTQNNRAAIAENSEFGGIVTNALSLDPLTPVVYTGALPAYAQAPLDAGHTLVQDGSGQYYGISQYVKGEIANPLAQIAVTEGNTVQNKIVGNVSGTFDLAKGLQFTSRIGLDYAAQNNHYWNPTYYFSSERYSDVPTMGENVNTWYTWLWENFLSYQKSIEKHNFTLLAGMSSQKYTSNYLNTNSGPMFQQTEAFSWYGPASIPGQVAGYQQIQTMESYYGRLTYDYDNKYLLNVTLRDDGTSLLQNKWGFFPSVSAGWNISEENFWKNLNSPINYFKLRGSWGQNGSLSNLSPDQFRSLITSSGIQYPKPGGGYYTGAEPELLANPELTWETSTQTDIGFDMKLFKGKMSIGFDWFDKITEDLLTPSTPPLSVGNNAPFVNAGDVTNKGYEFAIGWQEAEGEFHYNVSTNFTWMHNEVTYLNPLLTRVPGASVGTGWTATYFELGLPVWYFRGYQTDGIFQNQAQIDQYIADNGLTGYSPKPGDPIVVNNVDDGKINADDQGMIGSPAPTFLFGANMNFDYKGFDLNIFLQAASGNQLIMGWNRTDRGTSNRPEFFYTDRWTGDGSTNTWFRANTTSEYVYNSDLMVFDGSYFKIKQVQLGYTMPKSIAAKMHMVKARVFISLDNYFTFTQYPGMDVEAGGNSGNGGGIDRGYYPSPKVVMTGISLTL